MVLLFLSVTGSQVRSNTFALPFSLHDAGNTVPRLRKPRSLGQPILWWCIPGRNLGQPPADLSVVHEVSKPGPAPINPLMSEKARGVLCEEVDKLAAGNLEQRVPDFIDKRRAFAACVKWFSKSQEYCFPEESERVLPFASNALFLRPKPRKPPCKVTESSGARERTFQYRLALRRAGPFYNSP